MDKKTKQPKCWTLFLHTFILSAFTIGGGYVMISLMRERFVDKLGWIGTDELAELIALGQSAPGAMIVNSTVIMGYRLLGFPGAISALLGTALPPLIILSTIWHFYELIRDNAYISSAFRGMRAGVAAVIADTVVNMAAPYVKSGSIISLTIMIAAFLASFLYDINAGYVILSCGVLGIIAGTVQRKKRGKTA